MKIQLKKADKCEITNRGTCLIFSMDENDVDYINEKYNVTFEDVEYKIKSIESVRKEGSSDTIGLMIEEVKE